MMAWTLCRTINAKYFSINFSPSLCFSVQIVKNCVKESFSIFLSPRDNQATTGAEENDDDNKVLWKFDGA
jgi:hypothetical protein